ncbi:MAG: NADPH-dependent FMN reductase [Ilumatobacter sp.]
MSDSISIIGIVGSLRASSVNAAAALSAQTLLTDDARLDIHDVGHLPLYHGDEEEAGLPEAVQALLEAVRAADGIILFSPEYNSSLPAVTKNVIDWLSRDPSAWDGTGITMVSLSPGGRAAAGAREHFEAIMPRQATRLFPTIGFGDYGERMDDTGAIVDANTLDQLGTFLENFVEHCRG